MKSSILGIQACFVALSISVAPAAPAETSKSCELHPVFLEDFDALSISSSRIGPARWTATLDAFFDQVRQIGHRGRRLSRAREEFTERRSDNLHYGT